MDKYHRSVVHDVTEVAGLVSYTFGEEDVDRHIQVWKKEFTPCEDELSTLRRGETWDPVKFKLDKEQKEWRDKLEMERSRTLNKVKVARLSSSAQLPLYSAFLRGVTDREDQRLCLYLGQEAGLDMGEFMT